MRSEELLNAAQTGNVQEVQSLLTGGADVNATYIDGETPLHLAADKGYTEVINLLIEAWANPNAINYNGQTPLHLAAEYGHTGAVKALMVAGAIVDAIDYYGQTPLHLAAVYGHTDIVSRLILARAMVDATDTYGQTPLHLAAWNGGTTIVQALIANGADVHARDNNGRTPLYYAAINGHTNTVNLLTKAGESRSTSQAAGSNPGKDYALKDHDIFEDHAIDSEDDGTEKKRRRDEPGSVSQETTEVGAGSGGAAGDDVKGGRKINTSGYRGHLRIALTVSEREYDILNQLKEQNRISMNNLVAGMLRQTGIFNQRDQTINFFRNSKKQLQEAAAGDDAMANKRTSLWVNPKEHDILKFIKDETGFNITEIVLSVLRNTGMFKDQAIDSKNHNITQKSKEEPAGGKVSQENTQVGAESGGAAIESQVYQDTLDKELLAAAQKGNVQKVKSLLTARANVNARDDDKETALDMAKALGDEFYNKIINVLVAQILKKTGKMTLIDIPEEHRNAAQ